MRLRFFNRLVLLITALLLFVLGIATIAGFTGLAAYVLPDVEVLATSMALPIRVIGTAAGIVLLLLSINCLFIIFRRRNEKGFVTQKTEQGDLDISLDAIDTLMLKCVNSHAELKLVDKRLHAEKDGVAIILRVDLAGGVNIPLAVNALQKQIKQYVTACTGVEVRSIRVLVETAEESATPSPYAVPDMLAKGEEASVALPANAQEIASDEEEEKKPTHQRLYEQVEAPNNVPLPPDMTETQPAPEEIKAETKPEPRPENTFGPLPDEGTEAEADATEEAPALDEQSAEDEAMKADEDNVDTEDTEKTM